MADTILVANVLPLPLAKKISERVASNVLPLTLNRKLGTVVVTPTDPTTPKRTMSGVSAALSATQVSSVNIAQGNSELRLAIAIAETARAYRQMGVNVADDYWSLLKPFINLGNATATEYSDVINLANQFKSEWLQYALLGNVTHVNVSDTVGLATSALNDNAKVVSFEHTQVELQQPTINHAAVLQNNEHGVFIGNRHISQTQHAVPVPCRYYPIDEPPPSPIVNACRIRPPSSRLPLSLTRKRNGLPSSQLPLPLMCWHDQSPEFIPDLRSYIVLNTVTATIGGIAIDPIDFDFKCDMSGYCWQGGINITDGEYQKIRAKLDVERGNEPLVIVTTNNHSFAFIAEDITRNRKFASYSYNISGRSITAKLGADYANAQGGNAGGMIDQSLYASQIVQQQLANTGIILDRFDVKDWLIPANTYSVTGKTPIAVIGDIAKACGGFIYSDPLAAKLSILPRWRKLAWELATATPELVVPTGVMASISDKKRSNPRYNTVLLIGSHSANVYRNLQGLDRQAPIDSNALYTDRDCVVAQGQAILSDSGTHIDYSIQMRMADKYNIPLAMPSSIWQVSDPDPKDRAWNGVVQGVALRVKRDNDAITVWQNVTIDRYFDN